MHPFIEALNSSNIHCSSLETKPVWQGLVCTPISLHGSFYLWGSSLQGMVFMSFSVTNFIRGSLLSSAKALVNCSYPTSLLTSFTILLVVLKRLNIFWFWLLHWEGLLLAMKWDICLKIFEALNQRKSTFSAVWSWSRSYCREERKRIWFSLKRPKLPSSKGFWCF